MYSVVLLMAVTAGSESPDFGRRRGGDAGCYGSVAASCGCYGSAPTGCYGGCYGGYGGGCYGASYGGCYGVSYGGCYGGGYGGGYGGCSGVSYGGCYGSGYGARYAPAFTSRPLSGCYGSAGYSAPATYSGCSGQVYSGCSGAVSYSAPVTYSGCSAPVYSAPVTYSGCSAPVYSAPVTTYSGCGGVIIGGCSGAVIGGCTGGVITGQPSGTKKGSEIDKEDDPNPKPKPKPIPKPKTTDIDDTASNNAQAATLVVALPANARLSIGGVVTTSTSTERTFVSPSLIPGQTYTYSLEASFEKNGETKTVSRTATVQAGKTTRVDFNDNSVAVAGK